MPPLFKKIIPGQSPVVNLNGAVRESVRHPVPYEGKRVTKWDYVGNNDYRKINGYMRADSHQEGINNILDEMIVGEGRQFVPEMRAEAERVVASVPLLNNIVKDLPTVLDVNPDINLISRGMHFDDADKYQQFVNQHQTGAIVEYPAFTSTTIKDGVLRKFAADDPDRLNIKGREAQRPVVMEIQNPTRAGWTNDDYQMEFLYPANSRFEIVSTEPIAGELPGTRIIARETEALTPVETRTSGIMGRLKGKGMVAQAQDVVAAEELLNEHLNRQSRLGQTRSAYRDRMSSTYAAAPMTGGYDYSDRIQMV